MNFFTRPDSCYLDFNIFPPNLSLLLIYPCWFVVEKIYGKFVVGKGNKGVPYWAEKSQFYEQYPDPG